MKTIPLTPLKYGLAALVDDDVYEQINHLPWRLSSVQFKNGKPQGYAAFGKTIDGKRKTIYMHRYIVGAEGGIDVDHKNGDRLDNRKENLRIATSQQNCWNSAKRADRTSGFKGVTFDSRHGKWMAQICIDGKNVNLGRFLSEYEAAKTYDRRASEIHGEFARLNFPDATDHGMSPTDETHDRAVAVLLKNGPMTATDLGRELWGEVVDVAGRGDVGCVRIDFGQSAGRLLRKLERDGRVFLKRRGCPRLWEATA